MPSTKLVTTAALTLLSLSLLWALAPRAARAKAGRVPAPGSDAPEDDSRRTLSDGLTVASGEGRAAGSREAVEALQAAEIPEAGFPSDRSNDADRISPGLADFARGA